MNSELVFKFVAIVLWACIASAWISWVIISILDIKDTVHAIEKRLDEMDKGDPR